MLLHAAALAGRTDWLPGITASIGAIIALAMIVATHDWRMRLVWLAAIGALAATWAIVPAALVYLPHAALNIALGSYFASTLRPGREPRIARFARLVRGGTLPPDLAKHARRFTWIWTALFFGAAVVGLILALFASIAIWSTFTNVVSYLLVAALFVGEYLWRKSRFPHHRHAPLSKVVRIVMRDGRFPSA